MYRPQFDDPTIYTQPLPDWDWSSPFSTINVTNVPSCFSGEPSVQVFGDFSDSQPDLDLNAPPSNKQVRFGILLGEPDSAMGRNARPLKSRVVCSLAGYADHGHDHTHPDQSR